MKGHVRNRVGFVVLPLAFVALPFAAQQFALAVDVPSNLGGTVYGSNQIVKFNAGSYGLGTDLSSALGPAGHINALTEVSPGVYYLALDVPTTISGTTYQPSDILKETGGTFSLVQSGSGLGIPPGVGIGAITRIPVLNWPVIALTAPATIGAGSYLPGDLIQVNGTTLSLYWRSTNYGVPAGARIAGAEVMATNELLVQFDIPVTVASTTFAPGEILQFSGGFFSTPFFDDASFPAGSAMTDFALPGSPGSAPDGKVASVPLTMSKLNLSGTSVSMSWGSTCSPEGTGYGLYEGTIGSWYSHTAMACLGSTNSATFSPSSGNRYYLVAPNNGDYEGSYGTDSSGNQIPQGASACRNASDPGSCP